MSSASFSWWYALSITSVVVVQFVLGPQQGARRAQHLATGLTICLLISNNIVSRTQSLWALGTASFVLFILHVARTRSVRLNRWFVQRFNGLLRAHERRGAMFGACYFVLGTWLVLLLFPEHIALLSILFLAVGDPLASLLRDAFQGQLPAAGMFMGCVLLGAIAVAVPLHQDLKHEDDRMTIGMVLVGAAAATTVESRSFLDDNLTIPLLSAIAMTSWQTTVRRFI